MKEFCNRQNNCTRPLSEKLKRRKNDGSENFVKIDIFQIDCLFDYDKFYMNLVFSVVYSNQSERASSSKFQNIEIGRIISCAKKEKPCLSSKMV